ncbi:hypothetical protein M885DRAFT_612178 [Pelagophyceae sp. CCMP2097]|nr:hypothetical protein M885DRAFT_612178 [Pelagophyceae sp. CCMP2097]
MVSTRSEARCAVSAFTRNFPKDTRALVTDIVAAYGIRALLGEVPLEQLNLGRLLDISEAAVKEAAALLHATRRRPTAQHRAAAQPDPIKRCDRQNVLRAWPFVDDGGVAAAIGADAPRAAPFHAVCARAQVRRAKSTFAALRRAPDRLPRDLLATAVAELVGRPLTRGEVAALQRRDDSELRPRSLHRSADITEVEFLRIARRFATEPEPEDELQSDEDAAEDAWAAAVDDGDDDDEARDDDAWRFSTRDEGRTTRPDAPAREPAAAREPAPAREPQAREPAQKASKKLAAFFASTASAPAAPRHDPPAAARPQSARAQRPPEARDAAADRRGASAAGARPRPTAAPAVSMSSFVRPVPSAQTASSAARQLPPAPKHVYRADAPWRVPISTDKGANLGGGAQLNAGRTAAASLPRYLRQTESRIKPELEARRAALRHDKSATARCSAAAVARQTLDGLRRADGAADDAADRLAALRRSKPRAVDIADAFLGSPLVSHWDLGREPLETALPRRSYDDATTATTSDDDDDDDDTPVEASSWVGDFGPAHTHARRTTPIQDDDEEDDDDDDAEEE